MSVQDVSTIEGATDVQKRRTGYKGNVFAVSKSDSRESLTGYDVVVDENGKAVAKITTPYTMTRPRQIPLSSREAAAIMRYMGSLQETFRQEKERASRQPVPKPPKDKKRGVRVAAPTCDVCGDQRGNYDEDGNWVECPVCRP